MACYPVIMFPGYGAGDNHLMAHIDSLDRITSAKVQFVIAECSAPSQVNIDDEFDVSITYQLCTIEERNYAGLLEHFEGYDGIFLYHFGLMLEHITYWVWRLSQLIFIAPTGEEILHRRPDIAPGQKFTWTFHGKIEDLIGYRPNEPGPVPVNAAIFASHYGWYEPDDMWPYNWSPSVNFFERIPVAAITRSYNITVEFPAPAPYLTFNRDLTSLSVSSTEPISPTQHFDVRITLNNTNAGAGPFVVGCYCEGSYLELYKGTIGAAQASFTLPAISVTANQLAGRTITQPTMLPLNLIVSNNVAVPPPQDDETDRLAMAGVYVYVTNGDGNGNGNGDGEEGTSNVLKWLAVGGGAAVLVGVIAKAIGGKRGK